MATLTTTWDRGTISVFVVLQLWSVGDVWRVYDQRDSSGRKGEKGLREEG
jgi:hypothetical protein